MLRSFSQSSSHFCRCSWLACIRGVCTTTSATRPLDRISTGSSSCVRYVDRPTKFMVLTYVHRPSLRVLPSRWRFPRQRHFSLRLRLRKPNFPFVQVSFVFRYLMMCMFVVCSLTVSMCGGLRDMSVKLCQVGVKINPWQFPFACCFAYCLPKWKATE